MEKLKFDRGIFTYSRREFVSWYLFKNKSNLLNIRNVGYVYGKFYAGHVLFNEKGNCFILTDHYGAGTTKNFSLFFK